jgi:hypothetical protein
MDGRKLAVAVVLALLAVLGTSASASAAPALKRCAKVTGHPGGSATWQVHHIRLTQGFSCKRARRNIKTWIGFGGMMDNPRALAPWRCEFGPRTACRLRTSFGGTKPLRTYRLRFRIKSV